jgi:hypothetical protein
VQVVCDFCHAHLPDNKAAFESDKMHLINDDARAQLVSACTPAWHAGRPSRPAGQVQQTSKR